MSCNLRDVTGDHLCSLSVDGGQEKVTFGQVSVSGITSFFVLLSHTLFFVDEILGKRTGK